MSLPAVRNNVRGFFAAGFDALATELTISSESAALLDAQNLTADFYLTVYDYAYLSPSRDPAFERIHVATRAGQTLQNCTRGTGGTIATAHNTPGRRYAFLSSLGREEFEAITSIIPAETIQTDAAAFGAKVYDCLYTQTESDVGGGAMTPTAGRVYAMFFELRKRRVLDDFWIRYNTGSGSAKESRVGIFSITSDTNRYPKTKLLDVVIAGTSLTHVGSAGAIALEPGWYWQVARFSTTFQIVYAIISGHYRLGSLFSTLGGPSRIQGLRYDGAYGALPDTFPAGAVVMTPGEQVPYIGTSFSA